MSKSFDKIIKSNVDQDILLFLKFAYFGNTSNPLEAASRSAYHDLMRTIRFYDLPQSDRWEMREKVNKVLKEEIDWLDLSHIKSQSVFDSWHRKLSDEIKMIYQSYGIEFSYGQAQKWINMTIKYLYILEVQSFDGVFEYLHIPIDNYIYDSVENLLGIPTPKQAWSRLDDYDWYLYYQEAIREKLSGISPLRWEFREWLNAVQKKGD